MSHSHWPTSHPNNALRRHDIPRAECDRRHTEWLHFHAGTPCDMRDEPGYKRPRCQLLDRDRPSVGTRAALVASWEQEFKDFADKEARRIAEGGPPV